MNESDQLIVELAEAVHGFILDWETREIFAPKKWREQRVDSWKKDLPEVKDHTVAHFYKANDSHRIVTLGMSKFGLPDLCIPNMLVRSSSDMSELLKVLAQALVEKKKLEEPGKITLAKEKISLKLVVGIPQEGDSENLMEVVFPGANSETLYEREKKVLDQLLGPTDTVIPAANDPKLVELSKKAKKELSLLAPRFQKGIPDLESLHVKAEFKKSGGDTEYLWIQVTRWKGKKITGILVNKPVLVRGLKIGSEVTVDQGSVFDYIYHRADGSEVGDETGEYLSR